MNAASFCALEGKLRTLLIHEPKAVVGIRVFQIVVVGLLSAWITGRWVLRDAEACSADSVSAMGGRFLYSFRDHAGQYYGGEGLPFALVRSLKASKDCVLQSFEAAIQQNCYGVPFSSPRNRRSRHHPVALSAARVFLTGDCAQNPCSHTF